MLTIAKHNFLSIIFFISSFTHNFYKRNFTDLVFSRFWYITLNNKVLCGLMEGKTNSDGAKTMWVLCGLMGAKQALTGQRLCVGSVGCWWAAGGLWKVLATISWLCIAGAFTKFAIFENRIFFKTRRSQVKKKSTDFVFFHGFDIYHWITKCSVGCSRPKSEGRRQRA